MNTTPTLLLCSVLALYYPACTPRMQPTVPPSDAPLDELWQANRPYIRPCL